VKIELDWQAENEEGEWETIATMVKRPGFHLPTWIWRGALTTLLLLGAAGYLTVSYRYHRALAWTEFQIQGAIDSEAQALARGNLRLYLAQQDPEAPNWYALQATSLNDLVPCVTRILGAQAWGQQGAPPQDCLSPIQGEVQRVELRGGVAWVEVVTGDGRSDHRLRQARFYRQTGHSWLHTAPRPEFWNDPVERTYSAVVARYDERDAPYVKPLIEHVERIATDVGLSLGGFQMQRLEVTFAPELASAELLLGELPTLSDGGMTLPSPWISGIPLDGEWDRAYLDQLRYRVAYAVARQFVAAHTGEPFDDGPRLSQLQRALVAEYAAWYAEGDMAGAPILGRIVRDHGPEALPLALRSARHSSPSEFVDDWLGLSPSAALSLSDQVTHLQAMAASRPMRGMLGGGRPRAWSPRS
jgi:hypothetical protein